VQLLVLLGFRQLLPQKTDLLAEGAHPVGELLVELADVAVVVDLLTALQHFYLGVELLYLLLALLELVLEFGGAFSPAGVKLNLEGGDLALVDRHLLLGVVELLLQ